MYLKRSVLPQVYHFDSFFWITSYEAFLRALELWYFNVMIFWFEGHECLFGALMWVSTSCISENTSKVPCYFGGTFFILSHAYEKCCNRVPSFPDDGSIQWFLRPNVLIQKFVVLVMIVKAYFTEISNKISFVKFMCVRVPEYVFFFCICIARLILIVITTLAYDVYIINIICEPEKSLTLWTWSLVAFYILGSNWRTSSLLFILSQ